MQHPVESLFLYYVKSPDMYEVERERKRAKSERERENSLWYLFFLPPFFLFSFFFFFFSFFRLFIITVRGQLHRNESGDYNYPRERALGPPTFILVPIMYNSRPHCCRKEIGLFSVVLFSVRNKFVSLSLSFSFLGSFRLFVF